MMTKRRRSNVHKEDVLESVESQVLETIRRPGASYSPAQLVRYLHNEGLPDGVVRAALWYLIDRTDVRLTESWMLAPADKEEPDSQEN